MTAPADTPKICEQCKQRPKRIGRGRRFCVPCEGARICLKCSTPLKRRSNGRFACGKCESAQNMKKYHEDPETYNRARDLAKYKLTSDSYDKFLRDAQGRCAICLEEPSGVRHESKLHIDHDHETGRVRGLICGRCNRALGLVRDDVAILQRMIKYLSPVSAPC